MTAEESYKSLNIHFIFEVENYVIVLPSSVRNPDSRRGKEVISLDISKTILLFAKRISDVAHSKLGQIGG